MTLMPNCIVPLLCVESNSPTLNHLTISIMSSINEPGREGQTYPNTAGERVAAHLPGTEAHAERNEYQGRSSPGARVVSNVPGTAEHEHKHKHKHQHQHEHEHKRDFQRDPSDLQSANYDTQARNYGTSAAEPFGDDMDRGTGTIPSTGAVAGTPPLRGEYGTNPEPRVSVGDKIVGLTEKSVGKVMNKPAMVEKGVQRQTIGKEGSDVPSATGGPQEFGLQGF